MGVASVVKFLALSKIFSKEFNRSFEIWLLLKFNRVDNEFIRGSIGRTGAKVGLSPPKGGFIGFGTKGKLYLKR